MILICFLLFLSGLRNIFAQSRSKCWTFLDLLMAIFWTLKTNRHGNLIIGDGDSWFVHIFYFVYCSCVILRPIFDLLGLCRSEICFFLIFTQILDNIILKCTQCFICTFYKIKINISKNINQKYNGVQLLLCTIFYQNRCGRIPKTVLAFIGTKM